MTRPSPFLAAGLALCGVLVCSAPATAQLAPSGGTFTVASGGVRGNASAYDSRNNSFLVVGGHGAILARVVRADGTFASEPFQIDQATGYAQYPSVAYSPDADSGRGAYLVTWHQNIGAPNYVHARLIGATGAMLGDPFTLGSEPTFWEAAPKVAYASGSKFFMVTWQLVPGVFQIRAARVNLLGQNLDGGGIPVTTTGGERDPSIAYNSNTDQFLIVYTDFLGGATHAYSRLIPASTGAVGAAQLLGTATATYITDATFSTGTNTYLAAWYQNPGGPTGRLVSADGVPLGEPMPLSWRFGTYDSLGVAYNPIARATLMVGHDLLTYENGGVLISETGVSYAPAGLTSVGLNNGNFYPEVSSSSSGPTWLLTTSRNFGGLVGQFAIAPAAGPPPPPPGPAPLSVLPLAVSQSSTSGYVEGSAITFTASTTGGTAPLTYQFVVWNGVSWAVAQSYSTSHTFSMVPPAGTHAVQVWVRNAGSTAPYDGWTGTQPFLVVPPRAAITGFTVNRTFPSVLNVPITWTASANGAGSGVEYKFLCTFNGGATWVVGQNYSASNSFTWYPPLGGNNAVQVWVRRVGSSQALEDWRSTGLFLVRSTGALIESVTPSHVVPTSPSTTLNWRAVGIGGSGQLEYKFFLYNQATGAWSVLRDWGTGPQAYWTPGMTGLFAVQTWVRTIGSGVNYEDWRNSAYFAVTNSTDLTLTADRSLTALRHGDLVTWTAQVAGGGAWEYQFHSYANGIWTAQLPAYKSDNTFSWFVSAGERALQVWVRPAGSGAAWERWRTTGTFVVNP